jgi:hypothetical protein
VSQNKNIEKETISESSETTVKLQFRNGELAFPHRTRAATGSAATALSPRLLAFVRVGKEGQRGCVGGAVNDGYGRVPGGRVALRIWGCYADVRLIRLGRGKVGDE